MDTYVLSCFVYFYCVISSNFFSWSNGMYPSLNYTHLCCQVIFLEKMHWVPRRQPQLAQMCLGPIIWSFVSTVCKHRSMYSQEKKIMAGSQNFFQKHWPMWWAILVTLTQGWSNYGLWAASGLPNTLCIFSSTTFPTVDSSATALAASCHINHIVSGRPVAKQP